MSEVAEQAHHDSFESFDLADEEQIIAEMSGRASEMYIYELKQKGPDGQPVMGLSYAGTNWACRELAQQGEVIRVIKHEDSSTPDDPDFIKIVVYAQRFKLDKETGKETAMDSHLAGKRQPRMMTKNVWKDGVKTGVESTPDPFAWEKCLSKAARNAKQVLMPADMVRKLIAKVKAEVGKTKVYKTAPAAPAQSGAPAKSQAAPAGKPQGEKAAQAPPPPAPPAAHPPEASAPAAAPAAAAPAAPAPAPAAPAAGKPGRDVQIQKLDSVIKAAFKIQDGAAARAKFTELTGQDVSTIPDGEISKFGKLMTGAAKGLLKVDGTRLVQVSDGAVVFAKPGTADTGGEQSDMF